MNPYKAYIEAFDKYINVPFYKRFEIFLSILIVSLQVWSLYQLLQHYYFLSMPRFVGTIIISFLITDFFNGLVHLIVDNNTNYTSLWGPYVAAFHTHHIKPTYKQYDILQVYLFESGHKFWLAIFLLILCPLQYRLHLNPEFELGLIAFVILSSLAEVSHYLCHKKSNTKITKFLQSCGLLLNMSHHRIHHINDNVNYAFLNGMSDPLLNIIAKLFFKGYKNHSDKHARFYFYKTIDKDII